MTYRTNIAAGGVLSTFSLVYLVFSLDIKPFKGLGATPLDATFIPRMWGACLLLLSIVILLRGFAARKAALGRTDGPVRRPFSPKALFKENYEVVMTFVFLAAYTALLGIIGFTMMSALFVFAEIMLLSAPGKRNLKTAALVSVTAAVAIDYLFVVLLSVLLPKGIIGF